jgi:hypothetical protein
MADFGISKDGPPLVHTHVSTLLVHVVLFEVLCGQPVINTTLPRDQINLAEWALNWQRRNLLEAIIDPRLNGSYTLESITQFSEIAENCLADEGRSRPSMGRVLWYLESALQLHQGHLQSYSGDDPLGTELKLSIASTNIITIGKGQIYEGQNPR